MGVELGEECSVEEERCNVLEYFGGRENGWDPFRVKVGGTE